MKLFPSLALAAAALALSLPASAQSAFAKPEDAVKYRQSAMTLLGTHLGRLGQMAEGRMPYDARLAVENAEVLALVSHLPWAGFAPGTEKLSTKTKTEIWSEPAKFKEQADKMQGEMNKLLAAAKTNNLDNLKAAFGPAAATCKACHDAFRN